MSSTWTPSPARVCVTRALAPFLAPQGLSTPHARSTLAHWRRANGRTVDELPELWGTTLAYLPEEAQPDNGVPTREENAAFTTLALFAVLQQSRPTSVHSADISFGAAARVLADTLRRPDGTSTLDARFNALLTATAWTEIGAHLRSLTTQMRSSTIPVRVDFHRLAQDLTALQDPNQHDRVLLRWARDYHRRTLTSPDTPTDIEPTDEKAN